MRDLTLVGLSTDGRQLILRGVTGDEFRTPADDRLRATLRNDRARLGQLEIEMDSALRPRDIQARIRRGETPEAVAEAAQVTVDKIMTYAVPVLAEREHIVDRARLSTVRRKLSQGPGSVLGESVNSALIGRGDNPESAQWDSWRRDDGRWTITVSVDEEVAGTFVFDPPGRYVVAEDADAKTLVGDVDPGLDATDMAIASAISGAPPPASAPTDADVDEPGVTSLKRARARRALAQEQLLLDAQDGATSPAAGSASGQSDPLSRADRQTEDEAREPTIDLSETAEQVRAASEGDAPRKRPSKRRERRRVPSWDEIMFGGKSETE